MRGGEEREIDGLKSLGKVARLGTSRRRLGKREEFLGVLEKREVLGFLGNGNLLSISPSDINE